MRPRDLPEALAMLAANPGALALAGGTSLLGPEYRSRELRLVTVSGILPTAIADEGERIGIGAGATFQDIVDSRAAPEALRQAARGMSDRNIRNRATIGGNLGANKSCASLLPVLLALDAELRLAGAPPAERVRLADWLERPSGSAKGLVLGLFLPLEPGRRTAYKRYARTACDLSLLSAAVSFRLDKGELRGLRIAMGGLGARARRFPELETLFEGSPPPKREELERDVAPLLSPISDQRGSEEFKRLRAAVLLSDAFAAAARDFAEPSAAGVGDTAAREARP